ncbi:tetratricopeptide repeat protein [Microseira sp. BLCC-F43]|uniref:tetratricopeptide repeat protein n=1 Tax=Microseira sp. BLCC-F43 TaxID=3153602 RepID=UPI0035B78991
MIGGKTLAEWQRYEAARESYDRAIALYPEFYGFWLYIGNAVYYLEKYEEAIAFYDKGIQLKEDCTSAWINRGIALMKLERYEAANTSYEKAIQIESNCPDAWYNQLVMHSVVNPLERLKASSRHGSSTQKSD